MEIYSVFSYYQVRIPTHTMFLFLKQGKQSAICPSMMKKFQQFVPFHWNKHRYFPSHHLDVEMFRYLSYCPIFILLSMLSSTSHSVSVSAQCPTVTHTASDTLPLIEGITLNRVGGCRMGNGKWNLLRLGLFYPWHTRLWHKL